MKDCDEEMDSVSADPFSVVWFIMFSKYSFSF
jgi:hypothetical protein